MISLMFVYLIGPCILWKEFTIVVHAKYLWAL